MMGKTSLPFLVVLTLSFIVFSGQGQTDQSTNSNEQISSLLARNSGLHKIPSYPVSSTGISGILVPPISESGLQNSELENNLDVHSIIQPYLDKAEKSYENGEFLSTQSRYEEAIKSFDEAINYYEEVLKADPNQGSSGNEDSVLLEKEVKSQLARIKVSKQFQEPDTILYQVVVEDSDMSTPERVGYLPNAVSVAYSVDNNVYIGFDRINIEYWTRNINTGEEGYSTIYVSKDELSKWLCRQKVKESYNELALDSLTDGNKWLKYTYKAAKVIKENSEKPI